MNRKLRALILCLVVCLGPWNHRSAVFGAAAHSSTPRAQDTSAVNGKDRMGVLDLPGGSKFQTNLYDLNVIGQLRTVRKLPYYVMSGVGCQECDANVSIYSHSPSDGPMKDEGSQPRFDYPGRTLSREDRSVVSSARVFLGNCVAGHPNAVVWLERSIGDDRRWHESGFAAEIKDDRLVVEDFEANAATTGEVEHAVRKSGCRELPGMNQWEEP